MNPIQPTDLDRLMRISDEVKNGYELITPLLIIDEEHLISAPADSNGFVDEESAFADPDKVVRYFDLAKVKGSEYAAIVKALSNGTDALVLWNIDKLPDTPDFYDLQNMVYFALRSDTIPAIAGVEEMPTEDMKVVAYCKRVPEYMHGRIDGTFIVDTAAIK